MKALTIRQPYAQAIALGIKRFETRDWDHGWRSLLAIHAGRADSGDEALFTQHLPVFEAAGFAAWRSMPFGSVIAVAEVAEVYETVELCFRGELTAKGKALGVTALEIALGNWEPGRKAWRLARVRRLREPVAARGMRKLWTWAPPAGLSAQLGTVAA